MISYEGAVESVLPSKLQISTIWYYTKPEIARLIVAGDAFWATSVRGLNDTHEMVFGMDQVKSVWESRGRSSENRKMIAMLLELAEFELQAERLDDSFVLCASTISDSLDQWTRYGYCAIGLTTESMLTKVPLPQENGGRLAPTFTTGWRPVLYDRSAQLVHLNRLFDVLEAICGQSRSGNDFRLSNLKSVGVECILRSIVYLKPSGFASEDEVRLYGQARATGALVEGHVGSFGPTQHIRVTASGAHQSWAGLPLVEIRLGGVKVSVAAEAEEMRIFLKDANVQIPVVLVATPYRVPTI